MILCWHHGAILFFFSSLLLIYTSGKKIEKWRNLNFESWKTHLLAQLCRCLGHKYGLQYNCSSWKATRIHSLKKKNHLDEETNNDEEKVKLCLFGFLVFLIEAQWENAEKCEEFWLTVTRKAVTQMSGRWSLSFSCGFGESTVTKVTSSRTPYEWWRNWP